MTVTSVTHIVSSSWNYSHLYIRKNPGIVTVCPVPSLHPDLRQLHASCDVQVLDVGQVTQPVDEFNEGVTIEENL